MIAILEAARGLAAARILGSQRPCRRGVVALPLATAFAIASGAEPEQGIYTAITAGTVL
ncbi:MAG TPA: hypothetical protein VNY70_02180 [Steroidobacteraceae bacterium]|jgi:hypothetical protein|nr:hypothetical protein [Steroidobacteraceae bacterium]